MERRLIQFIAGLRAAGVRISIAESEDAFKAVQRVGMRNQTLFKEALQLTLIKKGADTPTLEALFPIYFQAPSIQANNLIDKLSPEEQQLLHRTVDELLAQLSDSTDEVRQPRLPKELSKEQQIEQTRQLVEALLSGQSVAAETFEQASQQVLPNSTRNVDLSRRWSLEQRIMHHMGGQLLTKVKDPLPGQLHKAGLNNDTINELMQGLTANLELFQEQVAEQIELSIAQQWADQHSERTHQADQLMDRTLQQLTEQEATLLRQEIRRLVAQLRSKIALRQKQAKRNSLDIRKTLRRNMRYGGVPLELIYKTQDKKPQLLLLCDISNSMRKVVEFTLRLVYELQDQVSNVRTFTYIDTLTEISQTFAQASPEMALHQVATHLRPHHPNTDLGRCLADLLQNYREMITPQTTVIIVGDACNSWNDPRVNVMAKLQQFSKEIMWLNPRPENLWEANDCDMLKYRPFAQAVYQVGTLTELTVAIDQLFREN
ncbi:MAG: VWA domain-containing protein [Chloroflexota bacterium]